MTDFHNVTLENGTVITEQYFDWNSKQKGDILENFESNKYTFHTFRVYPIGILLRIFVYAGCWRSDSGQNRRKHSE